jgi:ribonuclease Z
MLALVHVSSRYNVGAVLEEAREELPAAIAPRDFDIVEIPFPERGEPRLVPDGARQRRDERAVPVEPAQMARGK